jgi:general secretion pathway protein D
MTRPPLTTTIASLLSVAVITPGLAGSYDTTTTTTTYRQTSVQGAAERELARRRDYETRGRGAIEAGEQALRAKDYETAVAQFQLACDTIPNSPNSRRLYNRALEGFRDSSILLAEQRITEGRYTDAESVLKLILDERYDPHYKRAVVMLARLETPGYYNRTITPRFRGKVEEVKRLLLDADGFYETGQYDMAFRRYEQVLNIDPYNIAARKGQEKVNNARMQFANAAYNEARSRAIWKVEQAWANPVRKFNLEGPGTVIPTTQTQEGTQRITQKLNRIIIPRLEFREATIREAIDFLKKKSVDLDTAETEPARRGVNIVLRLEGGGGAVAPAAEVPGVPTIPGLDPAPAADAAAVPAFSSGSPSDARITVSLTNIPLVEALRYVTGLANLKFKVEPYAVSIVPKAHQSTFLSSRNTRFRRASLAALPTAAGNADALAPAAPADATRGGSSIGGRMDAKDFLTQSGVNFPTGASAIYIPATSRLVFGIPRRISMWSILLSKRQLLAVVQCRWRSSQSLSRSNRTT